MFTEIRQHGKKRKYYLVHSYRVGDKVKRIARYLGSDLNKKRLEKLKKRAEKLILEQIKEKDPFELGADELNAYKHLEGKIEHFQKKIDWKGFTETFTYNTNAIEGSTVEYDEVKDLLERKEKPENHDELETVNVAKAVEYIRNTKEKFTIRLIKKIHEICFNDTKSFAGKFRKVEVVIRDRKGKIIHKGAPADGVETLLKALVDRYNKHHKKYTPLLLASIVHNQFETIHPFQDGNGRVGRLLLNYVLLRHNYPPLNIKLHDREKYYEVLQKFQKGNDIKSTVKFFISQYRDR